MSGEARHAIDLEALLVALVLAPATYPRNRFFALYQDPEVRRVRRRASHLRGLVRQVAATRSDAVRVAPGPDHRVLVRYEVPALGLRRRVLLEPIELSLLRFAMARAREAGPLPPDDPDRVRVEAALARLAPALGSG